ncbi:hypothetical protein C463_05620 [Halorubrum californiense DSM 19288]|uniref:Uncharacterized protein n=1 Tax=Halorubrum californiense DSM 19288 TaxID=1227465 RepID=M0EHJ3_9EURY|nr:MULTISPECIES: hypothetical protein [Halorubrum]ELZ45884.1 hypothetical protein C463_05620 [Halorubrum californiense DSM 19288]
MGFKEDTANGIISLGIGVAVTWFTAGDGDHDTTDLLLAVAISSFLSGYFTSYFAK